jgi:hypothetical protein
MPRTALLALLPAVLHVAVPLAASTFELSGTVLDENGLGLEGAALTLVHQSTGLTRTAVTNASGYYVFPSLAPGVYSLEARLESYATSRYAGLRYFADTKPIFNITLRSRAVQESVTFTGEAPLVNLSQSQVGLSVEERQLEELPLTRRDYLELVTLEGSAREIPEAPPGAPVLGAPLPTVNGANAHYTAYGLDGFQNTRDQHGVVAIDASLEAVEEFRVVSGQFSAEYGQSLSGIVSASTRSGGNDFHGSAFAFVRPGSWDAADPLTSENAALDRREFGFTLGGPLQRERTHFFASIDYSDQDREVVVTAPFDSGRYQGVFTLPSDRLNLLFKISHFFDSRHRVAVNLSFSDRSGLEGVGGFDTFENRVTAEDDDAAILATLVSEFGGALSELRAGFSSERFQASAGPPPLGFAVSHPLQGNIGNPTRLERADEDRFEIAETLSFTRGSHSLKTGASLLRIQSDSELLRFTDGLLIYAPSEDLEPILYWESIAPPGGATGLSRAESHFQVFFQDDWQLSPFLTLNAGLRWEKETSVPDNDNFAPRLGFHWDASRHGKTSLRGGYGIYYGSVISIVDSLERLYGPSGLRIAASRPGDGAPSPGVGSYYVAAPEYSKENRRGPYAQHATFGIEREWAPAFSAAFDLTYIRGSDLILPSDLNAPSSFDYSGGTVRAPAAADATRPFGVPGSPVPPGALAELPDGFPEGGYRDLYLLASRGSSRFWGFRVQATKRYQTSFMLQAVYQWSRSTNDGDDYRVGSSLPLDAANPGLEWGRSSTDVPNSVVVNGVWDAPYGIRLAGIFRARSGRPVDPRLDLDLDGDLKLRERAVEGGRILERNSFRAPASATVDVSIGKTWEISESRRLTGTLDVLNLTNRLNPLQILQSYGPAFLRVVQAAAPRQFQLSVRFAF